MFQADPIKRMLREPLVHFLIAGLAVFSLNALRDAPIDPSSRTITIDEARVQRLSDNFVQSWQRPPNRAELDALIRDYIREEVYYREALRLGLDQDDPVVRRRLGSKMEFLARSDAESAAPDDATLQAWLDRNPAKYAGDSTYSFDQIYVGGNDPSAARRRALSIQAALASGASPEGMGDPLAVPHEMDKATYTDISRAFGDNFAAALGSLPAGRWIGPVASGFGTHVVRVRAMAKPTRPRLADVRQQVENDWREATIKAREARAYQALLDGYTIKIARPR